MKRDLREMLESWDGWPAAWRPEPGDVLVGRVAHYDVGYGAYGPVRTVIVETDAGERVSVWLASVALLGQFAQHKPKVGERIGLKYLGKHPERGYHRYRLVVDREEPTDFTPLGGESSVDAGEPW